MLPDQAGRRVRGMSAAMKPRSVTLVDAHVHVYDCFDLIRLLDAAHRNFAAEAQRRQCPGRFQGVLLFSERATEDCFHGLGRLADGKGILTGPGKTAWQFEHTSEPCSLRAMGENGMSLILVAGRQIITRENLEILALVTGERFTDGAPARAVVEDVWRAGGIAVAPWGVGKWLGARGRVVSDLLVHGGDGRLFLGDNSGRLRLPVTPRRFREARARGIRILPGTDPLPIAGEEERCGGFGFAVDAWLSAATPGADLRRWLLDEDGLVDAYGNTEKPLRFLRNQWLLRRQRGSC